MNREQTPAEVQAVLDAAADLLERDGWCQNLPEDCEGRRCMRAAIHDVTHGAPDLYYSALATLRQRLGTPWLTDWNDKERRRKGEVIAALRGNEPEGRR